MAGRPRSGSRLSQLLRQGEQDASGPDRSDMEELHASGKSPYSTLRSRLDASPSRNSIASSLSQQKTPARSYFHRSSVHSHPGPIDIAQDSSQEVREDTAELASWALSDKPSFDNAHSPTRHLLSPTSLFDDDARLNGQNLLDHGQAEDSSRPDVIPEVSEPVSPSSMPSSRKFLGMSALSEMFRSSPSTDDGDPCVNDEDQNIGSSRIGTVTVPEGIISQPTEQTALLLREQVYRSNVNNRQSYLGDLEGQKSNQHTTAERRFTKVVAATAGYSRRALTKILHPKSWKTKAVWDQALLKPAGYIPSVILGLLLNILDALSYGMILFPLGQPIFANLGADGISMFYVSCIVSQLVYSLGGSIFKGGIGSEMVLQCPVRCNSLLIYRAQIEVVPFFHKMAFIILAKVGDDKPDAVLATTILSFSISAIMTGVVFFMMGFCKLGALIGFFPRHILIGCIGGVGYFLVATGVEVSARLDGNLEYDLATLKKLLRADTIALWTLPLFLAICLILIKRQVKYSFVDAAYFLSIIGIFYFFVGAIDKLELPDLRSKGWVFKAPDAGVPFYHFYTLYNIEAVDWAALADTIPTMLALTFFGIIHVPINVPALGISVGEDNVDVDRELKAHGLSNALSGLSGSVQNYLVYTNSVLFVRSGGNSRVAGVMLAAATFGVLVSGPMIIGYIPIMVVGALIFFLGIDLMREALVEPWGKVHRLEYLTIVIIVITMGAWDFVIGILIGILLACVSFILQTSRVSAIRNSLPGSIAASTVRRHPIQNRFLQEAGKQIYVLKLAGYLFFGTIVGVEKQIRALLHEKFEREPIRFLILDLQNVVGIDFSAAEAFTRIKRILDVRSVTLIISGIPLTGEVGTALWNIGLFKAEDPVQFFETLNSALEHCENDLLLSLYQQRGPVAASNYSSTYLSVPKQDHSSLSNEIIYSSPRRKELQQVATTAFREQDPVPHTRWQGYKQPLQLLLQTFSTVSDEPEDFWYRAVPFFERMRFASGSILYKREEMADGFFLLESGMLKAEYMLPQLGKFSELIVAGTTCGELPFFSGTKRTSTTSADRDCVTWMLNQSRWEELQRSQPDIAQELLKISLKLTSERMDSITK
ncbi:MAG: hypothetical protein L6R42_004410 [Xanthoria sp. 1 TBL-2021]|nr:MAG: hypothetical protein L6R42_004410 [Xanthoria sp. 1 TBL-2021]